MKISIVGLGYVGAVCSACFANEGNEIIGVDIDEVKVNLINNGISPIVEKDLDTYIKNGVTSNRLKATTDLKFAIKNSDITIISVGTPSQQNGALDLKYIEEAAKSIGEVLKEKDDFHIVSMRSTVLPGTAKDVVIPIIEEYSNKKLNKDFGYISNPEFLRESTAIYDFYNPPLTVVGASNEKSASTFEELYNFLDASFFKTEIEVAETMKYASNAWHATKVTFANEIGMVCKELGIDAHEVMDIFCEDKKLNISSYYMKPGFAFGGSCLPKDVRAITHKAKEFDVRTPLLNSLMSSNELQIKRVLTDFIEPIKSKKIAILGLSFKADTDDLRESPILSLAERLIGNGYYLNIYDKNVVKARSEGANKALLEGALHHINEKLTDNFKNVIEKSDILIIGNASEEFNGIEKQYPQKNIIDLVRITKEASKELYQGLCW